MLTFSLCVNRYRPRIHKISKVHTTYSLTIFKSTDEQAVSLPKPGARNRRQKRNQPSSSKINRNTEWARKRILKVKLTLAKPRGCRESLILAATQNEAQ